MASYNTNTQDTNSFTDRFKTSFQNAATSAQNAATSAQNAYNQIQPYISQIQQFSFIISNPNMSDKDKSNAIIDFIMTNTVTQATQMADQTCSTSGNPLVKFICNLNTYKIQICSVVDNLANTYTQVKTVFDFVTTNPAFVQQLKFKLNSNDLQNISSEQGISQGQGATLRQNTCVKQIDDMIAKLLNTRQLLINGGTKKKYSIKSRKVTKGRKSRKGKKSRKVTKGRKSRK
jgi:hypothetical protein